MNHCEKCGLVRYTCESCHQECLTTLTFNGSQICADCFYKKIRARGKRWGLKGIVNAEERS